MHSYALVSIVTVVALLLYFFMSLRVGQARAKYGVAAPAITGNADFERTFRVHANTLEWLVIFLPSLWMFAYFWKIEWIAATVGLVWILGRFLYMTGYSREASARSMGFGIQALATAVLLFGSLAGAVRMIFFTSMI